jgi:hypothetical protein
MPEWSSLVLVLIALLLMELVVEEKLQICEAGVHCIFPAQEGRPDRAG